MEQNCYTNCCLEDLIFTFSNLENQCSPWKKWNQKTEWRCMYARMQTALSNFQWVLLAQKNTPYSFGGDLRQCRTLARRMHVRIPPHFVGGSLRMFSHSLESSLHDAVSYWWIAVAHTELTYVICEISKYNPSEPQLYSTWSAGGQGTHCGAQIQIPRITAAHNFESFGDKGSDAIAFNCEIRNAWFAGWIWSSSAGFMWTGLY